MRLTEHQVALVAFEIAQDLIRSGSIEGDLDRVSDAIQRTITADLKVEDALDEEVRQLLSSHQGMIRDGNIDSMAMAERIKKKLAAERKLVL